MKRLLNSSADGRFECLESSVSERDVRSFVPNSLGSVSRSSGGKVAFAEDALLNTDAVSEPNNFIVLSFVAYI
jgi:hypothetical protein